MQPCASVHHAVLRSSCSPWYDAVLHPPCRQVKHRPRVDRQAPRDRRGGRACAAVLTTTAVYIWTEQSEHAGQGVGEPGVASLGSFGQVWCRSVTSPTPTERGCSASHHACSWEWENCDVAAISARHTVRCGWSTTPRARVLLSCAIGHTSGFASRRSTYAKLCLAASSINGRHPGGHANAGARDSAVLTSVSLRRLAGACLRSASAHCTGMHMVAVTRCFTGSTCNGRAVLDELQRACRRRGQHLPHVPNNLVTQCYLRSHVSSNREPSRGLWRVPHSTWHAVRSVQRASVAVRIAVRAEWQSSSGVLPRTASACTRSAV